MNTLIQLFVHFHKKALKILMNHVFLFVNKEKIMEKNSE